MTEENKSEDQAGERGGAAGSGEDQASQTGDPGRTPGSAEGERETVEQDLRDKDGVDKSNS